MNSEETKPVQKPTARLVKLEDADRSFDIAYWQAQTSEARFIAALELVETYLRQHGRENELRLQRTVEVYKRISD